MMAVRTLHPQGSAQMRAVGPPMIENTAAIDAQEDRGWVVLDDDMWVQGPGPPGGAWWTTATLEFWQVFQLDRADLPPGEVLFSIPRIQVRGILRGSTGIFGKLRCHLLLEQVPCSQGWVLPFTNMPAEHVLLELPQSPEEATRHLTLPWRSGRAFEEFEFNLHDQSPRLDRSRDFCVALNVRLQVRLEDFAELQFGGYSYHYRPDLRFGFGMRLPEWEVEGYA